MNAEIFVNSIRQTVRNAAIDDVISKLQSPPGRKVSPEKKIISAWYNNLGDTEVTYIKNIVESSVDEAIFGFFAVIDGSRIIDNNGRFELSYVNEKRTIINDPLKIRLNEIFNASD